MLISNFDVKEAALSGSNLIEASAGTGKTYSIAILTLRLILEKKVCVNEILMVTFTKAAVAELEERIRLFIRMASSAAEGETISDPLIRHVVKKAMENGKAPEVRKRLKEAVLFLDETSIMTIHSFCQKVLTEYAFETGQIFGAEALEDMSSLLDEEVKKFWRRNIATLQPELLLALKEKKFNQENIINVVKDYLGGKRYFHYDEKECYALDQDEQSSWCNELLPNLGAERRTKKLMGEYYDTHKSEIAAATEKIKNARAKENMRARIRNKQEFIDFFWQKEQEYLKDYKELWTLRTKGKAELEQLETCISTVISRIYCLAISQIKEAVIKYKVQNNLLSFDDMIVNLEKALQKKDCGPLVEALQKKYRAVFIDEFQDTDKLQYQIFSKVFSNDTILFYIGDPKQSIYGWRKADLQTYFKARSEVQQRYTMNRNFRSSPRLIDAMNIFFQPVEDFDTFCYQSAEDNNNEKHIVYHKVQFPEDKQMGELYVGEKLVAPITIFKDRKENDVFETVAAVIVHLLEKGFLEKKEGKEKVKPSDIGILVRKNEQAADIKKILARYRIPAVTIDESKILESEEATYILYLLEAFEQGNLSNIHRALLSPFTGYSKEDLFSLNEEAVLEQFNMYKNLWQRKGVYSALRKFVKEYGVQALLVNGNAANGERTFANLFHLMELLHQVQTDKQYSALELINWLKKGLSGMKVEGEEYVQRMESDEEAVKIVTIHKSKGLEYNIVFAPSLDLTHSNQFEFSSFRDADGEYIVRERVLLSDEQQKLVETQAKQENRRLIYVAITRAAYKCYICRNTASYFANSSLADFIRTLETNPSPLVEFAASSPKLPFGTVYAGGTERILPSPLKPEKFSLISSEWARLSYTALAAKHDASPKASGASHSGEYDQFIFKTLTKGSKTGNLLHTILEYVDFSERKEWSTIIADVLKRFKVENEELHQQMLEQLLDHIVRMPIKIGTDEIFLSGLSKEKRINEFEFDFNVAPFQPAKINALSTDNVTINVKERKEVEGVLNGKMDMLFQYNNKFYILDWKSNYLGDTLEHYNETAIAEAMNESNYHLQYLIYTLAAKKYLESRLGSSFNYERDFGGVIYVFMRGARKEGGSGVFTVRPEIEQLNALDGIF